MTVSTSTNRIEYTGDAVTTAFSFPYYFLANGDLKVYLDGVLQTITTHYTVAGAGVGAGGTITFVTAPPNGDLVVIYREVAITQSVDYTPNDPFPANTHEQALDRLTMIAQQLDEEAGRSLALPSTSTYSDLTLPDPQAGYYLQWKADLSGLQNVAAMSPTAYSITPFIETLFNDPDAATARTTLGGVATLTGIETLTNKTLTSPVMNGTISGTGFVDEDTMVSNSDTSVPSQQSVKAYVDNSINSRKYGYPSLVGGTSIATLGANPAIDAITETDVAFIDSGNDELRCYRFNGSTWSLVGSGLAIAGCSAPDVAALNSTDIAYVDAFNDELRCYRFNGSTWSLVGSGLSLAGVTAPRITAMSSTDVALLDTGLNSLSCYRFNGSTWSLVGSGFTINDGTDLTALTSTTISLLDNGSIYCYRFNGSTWSLVGSGLGTSAEKLTALNETDVVTTAIGTTSMKVYRFNGSTWSAVSESFNIASMSIGSMTTLNSMTIAMIDSGNDELRCYSIPLYFDGLYRWW